MDCSEEINQLLKPITDAWTEEGKEKWNKEVEKSSAETRQAVDDFNQRQAGGANQTGGKQGR